MICWNKISRIISAIFCGSSTGLVSIYASAFKKIYEGFKGEAKKEPFLAMIYELITSITSVQTIAFTKKLNDNCENEGDE